MPNSALIYRVGAIKRISHVITAETAFTVSAVTIAIYDSAGTATVPTTAGSVDNGSADTEHEIYYLWTPATAGDYTYLLLYTIGAQKLEAWGAVTVLPAASKYDRYAARINRALAEAEIGDAQAELSYRQLMDAAQVAVRMYSADRPRRRQVSIALTAAQWEYPLSGVTGWESQFSELVSLEPDVDATVQAQYFLTPQEWYVDEDRATPVWGFVNRSPSSGETARLTYTTLHTLSHTEDTLPSRDWEAVCLYAAGVAAETALASKAARTGEPETAGGIVSRRDQAQRWSSQADRLKKAAVKQWRRQEWYL